MTSNQIDYYNARMKAKNDRLTRKENKRHNKAIEQAQYMSASAAQASASAAQSQAGTAQKRYQLEWESEYGFPYGTTTDQMNDRSNWVTVSDVYDYNSGGQSHFPKGVVTQSYAAKQFQIIKDTELARTEKSKRYANYSSLVKNVGQGFKAGSETFEIITGGD